MLGSADDAEEAVQEALIRAWRRRDHCRTPEAPLAWILQITRNEALRLAAHRPLPSEPFEADSPEEADGDHSIEDVVHRLTLEQAWEAVNPDERTLLALRYIDDLTQPEIARRLEIPEGTVKVRLHRIRARLRSAIKEP